MIFSLEFRIYRAQGKSLGHSFLRLYDFASGHELMIPSIVGLHGVVLVRLCSFTPENLEFMGLELHCFKSSHILLI